MISFNISTKDSELIYRIALRAKQKAQELGMEYDVMTGRMDIAAVHANGTKLHLSELAEADDDNFRHDVFGIRKYWDRSTGQLTEFFIPRFAA